MAQRQAISIQAVMKAVNGILTSLSEGKEIKVIFGGVPSTDGKTVYLGEPLTHSEEALEAYLSHGTHEIHHVLYSDFKEVSELKGLFMLVNVLEDVRIDSIGYRRAPGAYLWREEHLTRLAKQGKLPQAQADVPAAALLCVTCFWVTTDLMLGYEPAREYASQARKTFIERFGKDLYLEMMGLAEQAVRSSSTAEVISKAREMALRFARATGVGSSEREESAKVPGQERGSGVESEKPSQDASERIIAELFEGVKPEDIEVHEAVERSFAESRARGSQEKEEGTGGFWPIVRSELRFREDPDFVREAESMRIISRQRFQRLLQSSATQNYGLSRTGREIESRRLSRVFVGDGRIFKSEVPAKKVSAAITILLDRSGSMDRKLMREASLASLVLADLIDSIPGCASSVLAFPGTQRQTLLEVKDFGEKAFRAAERFSAIRPFGFTPVRQSVNSACAKLSGRREFRKIIFLITDGLYGEEDTLKSMIPMLESARTEIACIGIGEEAPKIFEIQKNIISPKEIEEASFELLQRIFEPSLR